MKYKSMLYTSLEMKKADQYAIETLKIPSDILMENAGRACAEEALSKTKKGDSVAIMAGPGSNGGDGFVAARHLKSHGRRVRVFLSSRPESLKGSSALNFQIVEKMGIPCFGLSEIQDEDLRKALLDSDLIIDSLLGTGALGPLRGTVLKAVKAMEGLHPILAIDGPTGVNLDDGTVQDCSVMADFTVTMTSKKIGHQVYPGKLHCGQVQVADIGVSGDLILPEPSFKVTFTPDEDYIKSIYPKTSPMAHKGSRGGVLVLAGSRRYPGAGVLASLGALCGGAGIVVLVGPEDLRPYAAAAPEVIFEPLDSPDMIKNVLESWKRRCSVMVLGPGLDRTDFSKTSFLLAMKLWEGKRVLDGDGLFFLKDGSFPPSDDTVITPHEGEASVLLGTEAREVSSKRLEHSDLLSDKYGLCLLKGPGTIVTSRSLRAVEPWSSQALAVPGSGDVLSGLVGAMISRGCGAFEGALLGSWIHGKIGHELLKKSPDGFTASQIARMIPEILGEITYEKP